MVQSQVAQGWLAEGEARGKVEGKVESLLRILRVRFKSVPAECESAIRATTELARLDSWIDTAATCLTRRSISSAVVRYDQRIPQRMPRV